MDNIISSTLPPNIIPSLGEKPLPVLPEELPPNLKPGDMLLLETIIKTETFKSGDLFRLSLVAENGAKTPLDVKLQAPLRLEGQAGEVRQFSARVMNDGSLQLLPAKPHTTPATATSTSLINAATPKLPPASFQPVKVLPVVENLMTELNFPPALKAEVSSALPPIEIMVALKNIGQTPQLDAQILAPIKATLAQMPAAAGKPQQLGVLVQELVQNIQALGGKTFPAQIAPVQMQESATVFDSPLGKIWSEQPLKLLPDTSLQLEVRQAITPPQMAEVPLLKTIAEALAKLFPENGFARIEPEALLRAVQNKDEKIASLLKVFEPLLGREGSPQLAAAVAQKFPGLKADVMQNMYNFYRAAVKGEAREWLGPELTTRLSTESPRGAEAIARLDNLVTNAVRETPLWRVIEIPFFNGAQIMPLQVAVKKDPEEEKQKQTSKGGLRFMVETEFSKLGAFQFDGFSVVAERRLDLVIRTSQAMDNDFCSSIINLFKKSLHDVDYIGSVKINQRESFIRVEKAAPKEGVYI